MSCAEKNQSPSSSPITSLPEDVVVDIMARVPICDYPRVSLVSKRFRSLFSSHEVYARRSTLGCTEHCLYVVLYNVDDRLNRLYTFRRKDNGGNSSSRGFVLIPGLPDMTLGGSFVAVGSRIYAFGGKMMTTSAFSIDCTSHTVQPLPRMPFPMSDTVADVVGWRIYLFGYLSTDQNSYAMLVFDTETQTWEEDGMTKPVMKVYDGSLVVMAGKMYMRDLHKSFVYDPKDSKWETEEMLDSKYWGADACVVDDVLYFYDWSDRKLRAYDPEHMCWGVVNGLDDLLAELKGFWGVTACYGGGKLVFFFIDKGRLVVRRFRWKDAEGVRFWVKLISTGVIML